MSRSNAVRTTARTKPDGLIEDPQWLSRCVERRCPFDDRLVPGHQVCLAHRSKHACGGSSCDLIRAMARDVPYDDSKDRACPVVLLAAFRTEEVEYRGPWYSAEPGLEVGYGSLDDRGATRAPPGSSLRPEEERRDESVLKSCLPVSVAIFATFLGPEFRAEYRSVGDSGAADCPRKRRPWAPRVCRLADDVQRRRPDLKLSPEDASAVRSATLKSLATVALLFRAGHPTLQKFVKRLASKRGAAAHSGKTTFYNLAIMAVLCFYPYLNHRVLRDLYDGRELVLMCFDKTVTKHKQWSELSSAAHAYAKRFPLPDLISDADLERRLPLVVTATLDCYLSRVSAEPTPWTRATETENA